MFNPFKTTLKYDVNPIKKTVTLTPTWGSILRAFSPSILLLGLLGLVGFVAFAIDEPVYETKNDEDPDEK
jgi:hypothetical protein